MPKDIDAAVERYLRCRALSEDPRTNPTERDAARKTMDRIREQHPDVQTHPRMMGTPREAPRHGTHGHYDDVPPTPAQAAGFDGPLGRVADKMFTAAVEWASSQVGDLFDAAPPTRRADRAPREKKHMGKKKIDRGGATVEDLLDDDTVCGLEVEEGEADDGEIVYTITMDIPVDVWKQVAKNGPGRKALTDWISAALEELAPIDDDDDDDDDDLDDEDDDDE